MIKPVRLIRRRQCFGDESVSNKMVPRGSCQRLQESAQRVDFRSLRRRRRALSAIGRKTTRGKGTAGPSCSWPPIGEYPRTWAAEMVGKITGCASMGQCCTGRKVLWCPLPSSALISRMSRLQEGTFPRQQARSVPYSTRPSKPMWRPPSPPRKMKNAVQYHLEYYCTTITTTTTTRRPRRQPHTTHSQSEVGWLRLTSVPSVGFTAP